MPQPKRCSLGLLLIVLLLTTAAPWPSMGQEPVQAPLSNTNNGVSDEQSSHDQQDRTDDVEQGLSQSGDLQKENISIRQSALVGQAQGVNEQPGTEGNLQEVNESDENASDAGDISGLRYEKMTAWSTFFMAIFAGFGLAVSGIATYFLIRTFEVTRDAAKAAQVSADAAQAVVQQDRADLVFLGCTSNRGRIIDAESGVEQEAVGIEWTVKNIGKSQALDISMSFARERIDPIDAIRESATVTAEPVFDSYFRNLLPQEHTAGFATYIPFTEIEAALYGDKALLVSIRVNYRDKYRQLHFVQTACQVRLTKKATISIRRDKTTILSDYKIDARLNGVDNSR